MVKLVCIWGNVQPGHIKLIREENQLFLLFFSILPTDVYLMFAAISVFVKRVDLLKKYVPISSMEGHQMPDHGVSLTFRNNLELVSLLQSSP